jgi:hypothetical protein
MGGTNNHLTQELDVYAFSICCVEILDNGAMLWQHQDDNAIVRVVLSKSSVAFLYILISHLTALLLAENKRPTLSQTRVGSRRLPVLSKPVGTETP